jgi:hypothetical protein
MNFTEPSERWDVQPLESMNNQPRYEGENIQVLSPSERPLVPIGGLSPAAQMLLQQPGQWPQGRSKRETKRLDFHLFLLLLPSFLLGCVDLP